MQQLMKWSCGSIGSGSRIVPWFTNRNWQTKIGKRCQIMRIRIFKIEDMLKNALLDAIS